MNNSQQLLIRLPNWVGDVIMTLPALKALHDAGFQLELFGKGWINDLLSTTPYQLHTLPKTVLPARRKLIDIEAKPALLFTNSFSSALQFRLSHKHSLGFAGDGRSLLLAHPIKKASSQQKEVQHEVTHFYHLAQEAALRWGSKALPPTPPAMHLPLSSTLEAATMEKAAELEPNQYVAICPFAVGRTKKGALKIWPHWIKLVDTLHQRGMRPVICPGPGEVLACEPFKASALCLEGLSLSEYAVILKNAKNVIANDSGPMHIASAVGAKTLGIFGVSDPARTYPWQGETIGNASQWPSFKEVLALVDQV